MGRQGQRQEPESREAIMRDLKRRLIAVSIGLGALLVYSLVA